MNPRCPATKLTEVELRLAHELNEARNYCSCLHVSLDDGNYEAVEWEVENVLKPEHEVCTRLAPLLLRMSKTQRAKLVSGGYGKLAKPQASKGAA